ncbi:MAG: ferrochelatase [Halioglobus sp.]
MPSLGFKVPQTYIVRSMKYTGKDNFDHAVTPRLGVLVTNLGSPQRADKRAVRTYLKEFLSDPRVVEIPRLLWWLILNVIILNIRPARSARAYQRIWTDEGSPLLVNSRRQAKALEKLLYERHGERVVLDHAMRYGQPALPDVVQSMIDRGVTKLLLLPLYPQYSCATTASTFDALAQDFTRRRWLPELRFVASYHDHPSYIRALADSIRAHRAEHGEAQKLVFSYHGEPRSYLDKGDPYHCQCLKTTRLVATELGLDETAYLSTFQSRFGKAQWLQPYTDKTLQALAAEGVTSVQVICPGFSSDCLETLEEIDMENRELFLQAGGERFEYIPCLNDSAAHITALGDIVEQELATWLAQPENDSSQTATLARQLGARN